MGSIECDGGVLGKEWNSAAGRKRCWTAQRGCFQSACGSGHKNTKHNGGLVLGIFSGRGLYSKTGASPWSSTSHCINRSINLLNGGNCKTLITPIGKRIYSTRNPSPDPSTMMVYVLLLLFLASTSSVQLLTSSELESCLTLLSDLDPTNRYNKLGVAWNELDRHERAHVLKEIAAFEKETITEVEMKHLSQLDDDNTNPTDSKHQCISAALKTNPTAIWKALTPAERHSVGHELTVSLYSEL